MADDYASLFEPGPDAPAVPLFPAAMGAVLHAMLNPEPEPGPPYVHTITGPRCDLEDCCETDGLCDCACHRAQPTHTITEADDD